MENIYKNSSLNLVKAKKVLMKKPQNFMSEVDLQKWNYTSPLDQDIINENYNEFYEIIKNSGTEIVDLKLRNENEELCDSIFTHDPSLVLNEGAIILNRILGAYSFASDVNNPSKAALDVAVEA